MTVKLVRNAEPLSFAARTHSPLPIEPILAESEAASVLSHELSRYCEGTLRGRSFLIAGHRGAGKTTLVDNAILTHQKLAIAQKVRLKPVPVYLQGPILLPPVKDGFATFGEPTQTLEERILIEVAQSLHQAVGREFVDHLHLHAERLRLLSHPDEQKKTRLAGGKPITAVEANEVLELAARFQIELNEAPSPERLQTFWERAGVMERGVLFPPDHTRPGKQGLRELVALNGVTHVYERISGEVKQATEASQGDTQEQETISGVDAKFNELVKPLSALAAGTVVGGSSAFAGNPVWALVLGVLAAVGASLLLKMTTTTNRTAKRKIDKTFIPDLKTKTLHRVMPELFERLFAAGLAPVFVVDELDKVDDLYQRIHPLLDNLKKLFAERALTCLLVDRGFYEQLYLREQLEKVPRTADAASKT